MLEFFADVTSGSLLAPRGPLPPLPLQLLHLPRVVALQGPNCNRPSECTAEEVLYSKVRLV